MVSRTLYRKIEDALANVVFGLVWIACLVALAVTVLSLGGCSEPATDGFDGSKVTAAELERQAQERIDAAETWAETELAGHEAEIAKVRKELDATRRNVSAKVDAGLADIERQWKQRESAVGLAQFGAGFLNVPGLDVAALIGTAAGAFGLGRAGRKKVADQAWDEAIAHAEAQVTKRDAAWDSAKSEDPLKQLAAVAVPLLIAKFAEGGKS